MLGAEMRPIRMILQKTIGCDVSTAKICLRKKVFSSVHYKKRFPFRRRKPHQPNEYEEINGDHSSHCKTAQPFHSRPALRSKLKDGSFEFSTCAFDISVCKEHKKALSTHLMLSQWKDLIWKKLHTRLPNQIPTPLQRRISKPIASHQHS